MHATPLTAEPLLERIFPFIPALRNYDGDKARRDLLAGLTVALFTIPQGLAYAVLAGFSPMAGITTAIVASILGAAFGSSEFLVNGPTNAISVMLGGNAALFASLGDPLLIIPLLTLMIGLMQVAVAALRLGSFTRFVSEPVLIGFTAGAGLYIVINQVPEVLGLDKAAMASDLWGWVPPHSAIFDLARDVMSLHGVNAAALATAASTFLLIRAVQHIEPRIGRRLPAPFIAIIVVTVGTWALGLGEPAAGVHRIKLVRDIQEITRTFPTFVAPTISLDAMRHLVEPMFAIGLMGAVEAIAIGKSLAAKAGHPFDANKQLVGEGLCNVGAALVGGFASSGSFSRTAVNYQAGAVTRASVIGSGVLVLVVVLLFAPAANFIPRAALAGTLVHIGLKLVDAGRIAALVQTTVGDRLVLVATSGAVLFTDKLEDALFLGIAVSLVLALRRAEGFKLTPIVEEDGQLLELDSAPPTTHGALVAVNLQGELFFAAAEVLQKQLLALLPGTRALVLRMQDAYNLDATTAEAVAHVAHEARRMGSRLVLCGIRPGMYGTFQRSGLLKEIGEEAIFRTEPEMLASTRKALAFGRSLSAPASPLNSAG